MEEKKLNFELVDWGEKTYEYWLEDTEDSFHVIFDYEDTDVDISYDEGTDVPYGSTMVCYEPEGYCYDGHGEPKIEFIYEDQEVSKEEFIDELLKQLEITKEDFDKAFQEMKEEADEGFADYVRDNIDEFVDDNGPDEPDPDDYYDWRY